MLNTNQIADLEKIRTPYYLYDIRLLEKTVEEVRFLSEKYGIEVHYAVKANSESRILRYIAGKGLGADCVSGNEVVCALENGFPAGKIAFAGVGKTDEEIEIALRTGIFAMVCESLHEISVVDEIASGLGIRASIMVRINPNIDAHTHKYITTGLDDNKFGIAEHEFGDLVELLGKCRSVDFRGLHFHIGSQITEVKEVFSLECMRARSIVSYFESAGLNVDNIDLGGGLGVDYEDPDMNPVPDFRTWFATIAEGMEPFRGKRIHVEPGRSIVAQCGSLITKVLYVKNGLRKTFLITDAGMNDLIRPALYGAYHKVENISAATDREGVLRPYDIVGPVCESSDVWGEGRMLPETFRGDLLAIRSAGAYGQVMASRYNLRDLAKACYSDDPCGQNND